MESLKVSEMALATTLSGSERIPIVQGGVNKGVTLDFLLGLPEFNVRRYGATGNGSDLDTTAINNTIAAMNAAGRGRMHFPYGFYKTAGNHTPITVPHTISGDGMADYYGTTGVSVIQCPSPTATVFTCTAISGGFQSIGIVNTSPTTPTAGTAILIDGASLVQKVDFRDVSIHGFYDCLDIKVGCRNAADNLNIMGPVRYGMRIRNTVNPDAGDASISNSNIWTRYGRAAQCAIRQESSGGLKIVNLKINAGLELDLSFVRFANGIELDGTGDGTSIFKLANSSIENYSLTGAGVLLTDWTKAAITGTQFGIYSGATAYGIRATDCTDFYESGNNFAANIPDARRVSLTDCPLAKSDYAAPRLVGGSGEPAFANGWQNMPGFRPAGFRLDAAGLCHLEGTVQLGTFGQPVFTLPVGYRPLESLLLPGWGTEITAIVIGTDGTVTVSSTGAVAASNLAVSLTVPPWRPATA